METYTHCVKCGAEKTAAKECPACGVIYAKAEQSYVPPPPVQEPPNLDLVACAICGKDISINAQACPHCGEPRTLQAPEPPPEIKPAGKVRTFLMAGFLIGTFILFIYSQFDPDVTAYNSLKESPKKELPKVAFVQCQDHVSQRLKSPSTANFPYVDFKSRRTEANTYEIQSYVDSQNSFGAMIRSNWRCEMQYLGGDNLKTSSWKLLDLEIL